MQRFARWVLGYHGTTKAFATRLISGELPVSAWEISAKPHDWLGRGIYFWEHGPARAEAWARRRYGGEADVIGALIQLDESCFDLLDVKFTDLLAAAYEHEKRQADVAGQPLPVNRGPDHDLGARLLDCRIINACLQTSVAQEFLSVRGAFWEGPPAFPGAMIRRESHIQIAVRSARCILGVFRPT